MNGNRDRERARGLRAAVCLLAGLLAGCFGEEAPELTTTGPAEEVRVVRGDFERTLLLTGEVEAVRAVEIKAPQTSIFQMRIEFMADEGSVISKGETILGFDSGVLADRVRDLETRILDAETQVVAKRSELASALRDLEIELAEREYARGAARLEADVPAEILSKQEAGERRLTLTTAERELAETHERIRLTGERGQAELDVLEINRDKLRRDLAKAEDDLGRLSVEAPIDGLVVYRPRRGSTLGYQEGDSCWPGQSVISLPDLSEMQVTFSVNEVDAPLLEIGMPVTVSLDAFPGRALSGEIAHIPSMAVKRSDDSKVAVFKVTARLSETWVGEMKPGMSALGRVIVERRGNVPLIPRAAVRFDGDAYRVGEVPIRPVARNETHYVLSDEDLARVGGGRTRGAAEPGA
jgi:hypothetical protein